MESTRHLAAIMFTDIVGYTQLMGRDEEGAIQLLRLNREIHQATIEEFGGKLLKEMGDGNLASFPTISGAVSAALKIQKRAEPIQGLNLRIGLHQGEILEERGDIFGDGVNIASRLQELAQPNQILVSETVYRNVRNRKSLSITSLGKKHLKNVDDQISVFTVTSAGKVTGTVAGRSFKSKYQRSWLLWGGAAVVVLAAVILYSRTSTANIDSDLTDKSIAILPFKTVGEEKEGEYFAQGIMDVLSVSLGKLENLQVRSGTSVARFTEGAESIGEIGEKLKVQFLLEGKAQKYGDDIRVILQLFDPEIDDMIWEDTYIRKYDDIFNVQNEIALDVVTALDIVISGKARQAIKDIPTKSAKAWDLYMRGRYYHLQYSKFRRMADIDFALDFYKRAYEEDPYFALALSRRAEALHFKHWFEFRGQSELKDSFFNLANRALQIDSNRAEVFLPFASYYLFHEQDYPSSIHHYERAVDLDPRNQDLFTNLAFAFSRWSNFSAENKHYNDSALIYGKHALELQPGESYERILYTIADSYQNYGALDVAEKFTDAALEYAPDYLDAQNKKFYLRTFQLDFDGAHSIAQRSNELVRANQGLYLLAKILHFKGEYAEAEKYYRRFYSLPPEIHAQQNHERTSYAHALLKNGKPQEADEQVELAADWARGLGEYDGAKVQLLRGERDAALTMLEEFEPWYGLDHWIAHDPVFDSLHDEQRFQAVVERCAEWTREKRRHVEKGIAAGIFPDPDDL